MILSTVVPEDPATLTLTIHRPDKQTDRFRIGQLDRDGLRFWKDYQPQVLGLHRWDFEGTLPSHFEAGDFTVEHVDLPQPRVTARPSHGVTSW
jgi:hypothetical protein